MNVRKLILPVYAICFVIIFSIYPRMIPNRSILIAILLSLTLVLQRVRYIEINTYLTPIVILFLADLMSNVINASNTAEHIIYFVEYCSIVLSISLFLRSEENENCLLPVCKISFYTAFIGGPVIGIIQMIMGRYLFSPVTDEGYLYLNTVISNVSHTNSNYTAINMFFCAVLALFIYLRENKALYLCLFVISLVCTALTFSRTAIFVCAVVIAIYMLTRSRYGKKVTIGKFVFFCVVILITFLMYDKIISIILNFFLGNDVQKILQIKGTSTISMRSDQWKASLELLFNSGMHGIIGYGDNASVALGKLTGNSMTAHNFLFGRLSESGLIGFILALVIYINTFRRIFAFYRMSSNSTKWMLLSMGGMLLCYLMISNYTWELLVMFILFDYLCEREERNLDFSESNKDETL